MFKWMFGAVVDWVIIVIAFIIYFVDWRFLPLTILLIGNRQHALAILGHDGAHRLICKNRKINDLLTNFLVFYPMAICLKRYREFHWDHHRFVGTEKDPELQLKSIGPFPMEGHFNKRKLFLACLFDLVGVGIPQLFGFMIHVRPRFLKEFLPYFTILALSLSLIYFGLIEIVAIWYWCLFTSFWMFFRLRVWSEHVDGKENETLVFDPTLLQKILFLPHNTWLHHEHHLQPGVAFSNLPQVRKDKINKDLCTSRSENFFANSRGKNV